MASIRLHLNLRQKLIWIYLVCIVLPMLMIIGILYFFLNEDLFSYENENRILSTTRFANRAANEIQKRAEELISLSVSEGVDQALSLSFDSESAYNAYGRPYVDAMENRIKKAFPESGIIALYGNNETITYDTRYSYLDRPQSGSDWYLRLRRFKDNYVVLSKSARAGMNSLWMLKFYMDLSTDNMNAILAVDMPMTFLDRWVKEEYADGVYLLVNQYNDILYASSSQFDDQDAYDSIILFKKKDNYYYVENEINGFEALVGWRTIGIFPKEPIYSGFLNKRNIIIIIAVLGLLAATFLMTVLTFSINRRFSLMREQINHIRRGDFNFLTAHSGVDEIGTIMDDFNDMTRQMNVLVHEIYKKELEGQKLIIEKQQAELNALLGQVNPHFLYNVLNTLRMKSKIKGEDETATMLKYVAEMFRRVLSFETDLITIKEEIGIIEEFLKVMQYRFEDRLTYILNVDENTQGFLIPKMVLQTFVENACKHGLEGQVTGCHLVIEVFYRDDKLHLRVEDNGKGMDKEQVENLLSYITRHGHGGKKIGLRNAYQRMKMYYGREVGFKIDSASNEGTRMEVIYDPAMLTVQVGNEDLDRV